MCKVAACCSVQLDYKTGVDGLSSGLDCIQYLKQISLEVLLIFWPIYRYIFFPPFKLVVLHMFSESYFILHFPRPLWR